MSLLFDADDDQVKVALSSALTISNTTDYIIGFWVYYTNLSVTLGHTLALLTDDPGGSGRRIMWTDDAGVLMLADEDAGGFGSYGVTAATWYYVVFQRVSLTNTLRIFPDSTSTTPLNNGGLGDTAGDTFDLVGMDTIIIGDIQPSGRVAMRMEVISLKVQTGVAGWSDPECRTESQKIDIQKAGGTERYAWLLEDTDSDTTGLNERNASGNNFTLSGGTVTVGSNRPTQLEAAGGGGGGVPTYKPVTMFPVGNTPMTVTPAGRNLFNFTNV